MFDTVVGACQFETVLFRSFGFDGILNSEPPRPRQLCDASPLFFSRHFLLDWLVGWRFESVYSIFARPESYSTGMLFESFESESNLLKPTLLPSLARGIANILYPKEESCL